MTEFENPCARGLTSACFAACPEWARTAFAYRLFCIFCPPAISRKLQVYFRYAQQVPSLVWPPMWKLGDPLPPGWIIPPGTVWPDDWTPGDPLPPGVVSPPGAVVPPGVILPPGVIIPPGVTFPPGWTPGDLPPPGVVIPPGTVFPPGWTLGDPWPPGVIVPPGTVFPPGWTPPDPLPPGVIPPPIDPNDPPADAPVPPLFVPPGQPGPPTPPGGKIYPPAGVWFEDRFKDLDLTVWTESHTGSGTATIVEGALILASTQSGKRARIERTDPRTCPINYDMHWRMTRQLDFNDFTVRFYNGNISMHFYVKPTGNPSGLKSASSTSVTLWSKRGEDDRWKVEVRDQVINVYLNDVNILADHSIDRNLTDIGYMYLWAHSRCTTLVESFSIEAK